MPKFFLLILFILQFFTGFIISQEQTNIDSLKLAIQAESNSGKKFSLLTGLADTLLSSDPDTALGYGLQSYEIARQSNNRKNQLTALLLIGKIYMIQADFRNSLEIGNRAKTLALDLDLDREYAKSLMLIAINYSILGDFEKSAELNFEALRIFEKLEDWKGIGSVYNRIGNNYFYQENREKAAEFYTKSLEIARENNDLPGISRGLNNMAIVFDAKKNYDDVKAYIKESIEINKTLGQKLWVGINYSNLASVYRSEGVFDTSYYYMVKAKEIFKELNSISNLANTNYGFSLYYSETGNLDSALYYAELAESIARENDLKKLIYSAVSQQRNIFHQKGDFEKAFEYSIIELQLKDSLDISNTMDRISQLELLYEFDKREQEIKINQQRREFTLIIAGTSLVFLLLILVIIVVSRSRMKAKNEQIERKRLNMELEIRNRELAANVMTLIRKNEILSKMGDKLMDIQSSAAREETKYAIRKIAADLQKTTDTEIWEEFEVRFNQVHGEFYEKLHEKFPDLTPNEHRLCAFLRLNMTSKEISELTGQRIDTLEIARWRLRKKLGITNTKTNLVNFLAEL